MLFNRLLGGVQFGLTRFVPRTTASVPGASSPLIAIPVREMKVKSAIKKLCEHCVIRRKKNKKWYVYCKDNPRHKQRQL